MMAISNIGSSPALIQGLSTNSNPVSQGNDPDGDGSRLRGGAGGRFASAINQALTQIGLTPPDASSASATQDPKQAEQAFAQALFGALQGQNADAAQGSGAAHKGGGGHHHHGGGGAGKVESGLQNLIQQLSASTTGATSAATSDTSALSALQTSFDSLVAANGGTPGNESLSTFLQNLAQNLQGAPSSGNVVSTKA
jgi:hypothetical protein